MASATGWGETLEGQNPGKGKEWQRRQQKRLAKKQGGSEKAEKQYTAQPCKRKVEEVEYGEGRVVGMSRGLDQDLDPESDRMSLREAFLSFLWHHRARSPATFEPICQEPPKLWS